MATSFARAVTLEQPCLDVGIATDAGRRRSHNQDAVFCEPTDSPYAQARGVLCVVADGMGGHSAGEVASRLAIEATREAYYHATATNPALALHEAIRIAHGRILAEASADPSRQGMGTTLTAAVIHGRALTIGHLGDSRAYLVAERSLRQLTTDHTWVEEQRATGMLTADQARTHPHRNALTQALGRTSQLHVQIVQATLHDGDTLLLCSDGLHGPVPDDQFARLVWGRSAASAAAAMVDAANRAGGPDNISAIVVRVNPGPGTARAQAALDRSSIRALAAGLVALALLAPVLWMGRGGPSPTSAGPPSTRQSLPLVPTSAPTAAVAPVLASPSPGPPGECRWFASPLMASAPETANVRPKPRTAGPDADPIDWLSSGRPVTVLCEVSDGEAVEVPGGSYSSHVWYGVSVPPASSEVGGYVHCSTIGFRDPPRVRCESRASPPLPVASPQAAARTPAAATARASPPGPTPPTPTPVPTDAPTRTPVPTDTPSPMARASATPVPGASTPTLVRPVRGPG
ncbi:MAG: protein phosphatase 2C domain-containing protein [Chloroflexi bacterium]|nr:protein phosphatase 2C domain-containing protein [Chloroflexota bacterium]